MWQVDNANTLAHSLKQFARLHGVLNLMSGQHVFALSHSITQHCLHAWQVAPTTAGANEPPAAKNRGVTAREYACKTHVILTTNTHVSSGAPICCSVMMF